jgi:hypothetical protein
VLGPLQGHKRAGLLCSGEPRTNDGKDEPLIMMRTSKSMVVCSAVQCGLLVGLAYGVSNGEKAEVKGVIATRTGETLVLATDSGNVTVVLNDDTKVQQPKGLGMRKKQMSVTVLVPSLRITADGVGVSKFRLRALAN